MNERERKGSPVAMMMAMFVVSWGHPGPQGLWVIHHRKGKAAASRVLGPP